MWFYWASGLALGLGYLLPSRVVSGKFGSVIWAIRDDEQRVRVGEPAEQVGIKALLQRKSGELSHRQEQWLEIAMPLAPEPKLLLVDEPAARMTPAERKQTATLLVDLARAKAALDGDHLRAQVSV